jgi:hypothetical protein
VKLVPTPIPPDLMHAAVEIAEGVEKGAIIGMGVVVQLRGGKFYVDVLGRMTRDPHNARGWLRSLDDCLRTLGERERDTSM